MLLHRTEEAIIYSYLIKGELKQLYRRFGHPFIYKLARVLERAGYKDINTYIIKHLTKFYKQC